VIAFPIEILFVLGFFAILALKNHKNEKNLQNGSRTSKMLLQTNNKKILQVGFLLMIPWVAFFLFWFAYNDYFFGDPLANYRNPTPANSVSPDASKSTPSKSFSSTTSTTTTGNDFVSLFFKSNENQLEWIKFYSVGLLPDNLQSNLINISSTDVTHFLSKNWLSVFVFLILISGIAISVYDKSKRTEVFVLIALIVGTLLFYSSDYIASSLERAPSPDVQERYMISSFVFSSMLFGFILQRIWGIKLGKFSKTHEKTLQTSFKVGFAIILGLFLVDSFYDSTPVQKIMNSGVGYMDPINSASRYPLDSEGLTPNSIVVDRTGRRTMEYDVIPFDPNTISLREWNPDLVSQSPIKRLKQLLNDGNEVFAFKYKRVVMTQYYLYLQENHGIILKDHSETFCKLQVKNDANGVNTNSDTSDMTCLQGEGMVNISIGSPGPGQVITKRFQLQSHSNSTFIK